MHSKPRGWIRVVVTLLFGCATAVSISGTLQARAAAMKAADWSPPALGSVDTAVFSRALNAANCAIGSGAVSNPSTLTIIAYSKPSTDKRLWVFDLASHSLLYNGLVAHGQGSGNNMATEFSNAPETHRS